MEAREIIVINFGAAPDGVWPSCGRASIAHAAKRWGATIREITEPAQVGMSGGGGGSGGSGGGWGGWFGAKLFLDRVGCSAGTRMLYLDCGDMLVRSDCPNPFEMVPAERFAGVLNFQGDTHGGNPYADHQPYWNELAGRLGNRSLVGGYDPSRYINGGFMLWTAGVHDEVFQLGRKLLGPDLLSGRMVNPMLEQTAHNIAIAQLGCPLSLLPLEFNRLGAATWGLGGELGGESGGESGGRVGGMSCYIHHWANLAELRDSQQGKAQRMAQVQWKVS